MILGYVVFGFVVFAIAGAVVAFRLQGKRLRNTALVIGAPVLVLYVVLGAIALTRVAAEREPDAAFAPAGEFTVTMERVDTSDPYLFVRMQVDSKTRTWTQTGPAPEHKVCSAKIKAENLIEVRNALDGLLAISGERLADCRNADLPVVKRLHWNLVDRRSGEGGSVMPEEDTLEVDATCLTKHVEIAQVFLLVETISLQAGGNVRCK
jgi:hypothetical protein